MEHIRRPTYRVRLIAFFLILGILPVVLLGIYAYWKSASIARDKVTDGNMNLLHQTEMMVEQKLKTIDNSATLLLTSSAVHNIRDKPLATVHFELFNGLLSQMHQMQAYDTGIQDATFINLNQDWLVNNRTMSSLSDANNQETIDSYLRHPSSSFWQREVPADRVPSGMAATEGINLIKKLPVYSNSPYGLFIVKIPSIELNQILSRGQSPGSTIIMDSDGYVIASVNESDVGRPLSSFGDFTVGPGGEEAVFFEASFSGIDSGVAYRRSPYNDWVYLSAVPMNEMTRESTAIGWATFSLSVAIVLLLLIASLVTARRMYRPIKQLVNSLGEIPHIASGVAEADEFQFIGGRILSLHDTRLSLENELHRQLPVLRELFMLKLFQGRIRPSAIREKLAQYGYSDHWKRYNVLSVQIDNFKDTTYRQQDNELLLYAVNNIVSELIPGDWRLSSIVLDDHQVSLVGALHDREAEIKAALFEIAEEIQSTVKRLLGLAVSVGVSNCFEDVRETPTAYRESIDALKYRLKLGPESIVLMEEIQPADRTAVKYPEQQATDLIDAIKRLDGEEADKHLKALLQTMQRSDMDFNVYQMALVRLLVDLERMVEASGVSLQTENGERLPLLSQLLELKTANEIERWFREGVIVPVMQQLERKQGSQYQRISDQMLAIIHDNYHTELTLDTCSAMMNYHPNYLKRVFRYTTGTNFSDYVMQHRISVAKKWLVETNMKVSEIADKVGYKSPQNFIRFFRRVEGKTPGQYRESNMN
ncbi:helix-turn-helix domain-containing protein [Cohnella cellulosilytica]|uniref:Helix-turn-helix domain-containing protein n=1 Tax=Cohnella cellulosilytica TaxID=986710 RepID=A0ABW2FAJ9_9BACL